MTFLILILSTLLGLSNLHNQGYTGQGVTIALIDGGFHNANNSSLFPQAQITDSFDLLEPDSIAKYGGMFANPNDAHGTHCLSTIIGRQANGWTGTAPDANVILIRTEELLTERVEETDRLIQALYLADSLDVDVISISLGYHAFDDTTTNFKYPQMDGTLPLSQAAADVATRRLVCIAVGNSGNKAWRYVDTPGDAENVITVGATDSLGVAAEFSSWGPTADGRQKPEVVAWGKQTWTNAGGGWSKRNGTSFATPEVAGMCACLRQALPTLTPAELRELIFQSCDSYDKPDYHLGYGTPNAEKVLLLAQDITTQGLGHAESHTAQKKMRNGVLTIVKNGQEYNLFGQRR